MENIWLIQVLSLSTDVRLLLTNDWRGRYRERAATDGMLRKISDMSVPNLPISNYGPGLAERVTTV